MSRLAFAVLALASSSLAFEITSDLSTACSVQSPLPKGTCAKVFRQKGCGGWDHSIVGHENGAGFLTLPEAKQNQVQSVVVQAGCVFFGYTNDWSTGDVVVVSADDSEFDVADDLEASELGEQIKGIGCYCDIYQRSSGLYHIGAGYGWSNEGGNSVSVNTASLTDEEWFAKQMEFKRR